MTETVRFFPRSVQNAQANLSAFVEMVRTSFPSLLACNSFDDHAWSIDGLGPKGCQTKFVYFCQLGVQPRKYYRNNKRIKDTPADISDELLMP
jgi:hypothetical protein